MRVDVQSLQGNVHRVVNIIVFLSSDMRKSVEE